MSTNSPEAPPRTGNRFFSWMRGTGVVRQPGWIGGVCAGIADRLGVDPLIVRGIAVVIAVLGGPAILVYAAAWLLLPDRFDKIHLEQLGRGKLESPVVAIAALVVLSMLPVTQGFWSAGNAFWSGGVSAGRILWTIVLLGLLIGFVVWASNRSTAAAAVPRSDVGPDVGPDLTPDLAPDGSPDVADDFSADEPTPTSASPSTAPFSTSATTTGAPTVPFPATPSSRPLRPTGDAPAEDFAVWRDQQAAWKAERAAFQAHEATTHREMNEQRARERRELAEARAAVYAEKRRAWDRANPRLSGAFVSITIGVATLAGGIAALVSSLVPEWKGVEVAAGLGTATIVLGVVIVTAAAFGRRNGFMVFLSVVLVLGTVIAAALPNDRSLVGIQFDTSQSGNYTQLAGRATVETNASTGDIDFWQGSGTLKLVISEGDTVRVVIDQERGSGSVNQAVPSDYVQGPEDSLRSDYASDDLLLTSNLRVDSTGHYSQTFGSGATPDSTVRIWQGAGSIDIIDNNEKVANS